MVCSYCRGTGSNAKICPCVTFNAVPCTHNGVHESKTNCKEFKDKTEEIFSELQEEFYSTVGGTTDGLPTRKKAKELATSRKKQEWKEYDQEIRTRQREEVSRQREELSRREVAARRAEFREELRIREVTERAEGARRYAEQRMEEEVDRQRVVRRAHASRLTHVANGFWNIRSHLVRESIEYFQTPQRAHWEQSRSLMQRLANNVPELQSVLAINNVQRSLLPLNTTTADIKINTVKEPFESSECPVCMEEFGKTDIMVTTCGHKFHTTCMFKHLRTVNNCPCCRGVLF